MNHQETYEALLFKTYDEGTTTQDRTGVGTRHIAGGRMVYDLTQGFPLITTKKVWFKGVAEELFWVLNGDTNARTLQKKGVHIWDEWAHPETGDLGRVYGAQWREWRSIGANGSVQYTDQIAELERSLKDNPESRRHLLTNWNPGEIDQMALPPCHNMAQFVVIDGALHCIVSQRSIDMLLGAPFDLASYALLTHLLADVTGYTVGTLTYNTGDTHIYNNHIEQVEEQLDRPQDRPLPRLTIVGHHDHIWEYTLDDIQVVGYDPYPAIKAPVAI